MIVKRGQYLDTMCAKIKVRRKQPGSGYLSKQELVMLCAFVDAVVARNEVKANAH